ncbi:MAG: PfkB family carbohydrate kinase [Candidatus Thorarchaeota archaeon]|jgi:sugar/nucleoside kinase (ribokinase family)
MDIETAFWPFLLFLPKNFEKRQEFIRSVLGSRLAHNVLCSFKNQERVLQRDLVKQLPHSNKSILEYLRTLTEFGLLTSGSSVHGGKRVVFHELTKTGWSLARFFSEGLPSDLTELTTYLLEDYLMHLVSLSREEGINDSLVFDVFARMRAKVMLNDSPSHECPDFILFGASAYFTHIECPTLPPPGNLSSCKSPTRAPGGPTIDLALALAKGGFDTTFVSSVGNDQDGWNVITGLIQGNVDVSRVAVRDQKRTNETIVVNTQTGSRTLVGIGELASLSLESPSEVPWFLLENSRLVYIGEVFVEVAVAIAAYARARRIPVIYRCSIPFLQTGLDNLEPVFNQVDVLVFSYRAWQFLRQSIGKNPVSEIQKRTNADIVVRSSKKTYKSYGASYGILTLPISSRDTDLTDHFMMGLLTGINKGLDFQKALEKGVEYEETRRIS